MQGMLSQFKGLVVDWNHGQVKFTDERGASGWELLRLSDAFWRDLDWFDDHFEHRNCTSLEEEPAAAARASFRARSRSRKRTHASRR